MFPRGASSPTTSRRLQVADVAALPASQIMMRLGRLKRPWHGKTACVVLSRREPVCTGGCLGCVIRHERTMIWGFVAVARGRPQWYVTLAATRR